MRAISPELAAALDAEVGALAICWRIVRNDGVALGFTTHDRTIWQGGLEYRPSPGMNPSAIQQSDGFDVTTMEVAGALSDAAISDADLAAGLYDGARVSLSLVDWSQPQAGAMPLARGAIGQVTRDGAAFTAELRGPTRDFEASPVERLSPECRAELGDRRCRIDLARWSETAIVAEADGATVTLTGLDGDTARFAYGRLRSATTGRDSEIVDTSGAILTLREPAALGPGERIELRAGCDKTFATCRARFANAANFRGEPHVPGTDAVTAYPGL